MSRIDPIRRADLLKRAAKPETEAEEAPSAEVVRLPVPVDRVVRVEPRFDTDAHAAFAAHLIGQEGQKRGLRAGPELFDTARVTYNRTEWSGAKDRRAPKGCKARTEV
ncbi:hypothetical protein [Phenylobacterium soli]|nr:hypothetical protein [Phenylobacterium soli]